MIESAKKALTPEQQEEYKKMGEYMYNSIDYQKSAVVSTATEADLIIYAKEMLKAGGNPFDLTKEELGALKNVYGDEWYLQFDLKKEEVPDDALNIKEPILKRKRVRKVRKPGKNKYK